MVDGDALAFIDDVMRVQPAAAFYRHGHKDPLAADLHLPRHAQRIHHSPLLTVVSAHAAGVRKAVHGRASG